MNPQTDEQVSSEFEFEELAARMADTALLGGHCAGCDGCSGCAH
jgi:hypothetical protein